MAIILNQILTPDGTILRSTSGDVYDFHHDSVTKKLYAVSGGVSEVVRVIPDRNARDISVWSYDTDESLKGRLHVKFKNEIVPIRKLNKKQVTMYLKNLKTENLYDAILRNVLTSMMMLFIVFGSFAQKLSLPDFYETKKSGRYPVSYEHNCSFDTKEEAIESHLKSLDWIGIDTSYTAVKMDWDTPVFSSFLLREDKKTAIITYVRMNEEGRYTSYFLESKNVEFDLFESDGYVFVHEKIK
jgi:hypothetical protein